MKPKTCIVLFIVVVAALSLPAHADYCILRGFVTEPDGTPVHDGTPMAITENYYGVRFPIVTGSVWPYPNYYLQAFRCMQGDAVELSIETAEYHYRENITLVRNLFDFNFTVEVKKSASPGGGGGGGSEPGTGSPPELQRVPASGDTQLWIAERERIEIFTYDVWMDVRRFVAEAYKIEGGKVTFVFKSGPTVVLGLGENVTLDLDADGSAETNMRLDKVEGKRALVSFMRMPIVPPVEKPTRPESPTGTVLANASSPPAAVTAGRAWRGLHIILVIVIFDLLLILVLQIWQRRTKNDQ